MLPLIKPYIKAVSTVGNYHIGYPSFRLLIGYLLFKMVFFESGTKDHKKFDFIVNFLLSLQAPIFTYTR